MSVMCLEMVLGPFAIMPSVTVRVMHAFRVSRLIRVPIPSRLPVETMGPFYIWSFQRSYVRISQTPAIHRPTILQTRKTPIDEPG